MPLRVLPANDSSCQNTPQLYQPHALRHVAPNESNLLALVMPRLPGTFFARNLVERRGLIFQLVRRDFEQRFVGSAAGWLWGLIHPLVLLLSWSFVFSVCLRFKLPPGEVTQNYPLYLFAGMLPWLLFNDTVMRSSTSMLDNANLITKTVFPAEVAPISVFLSSLISHGMALVLVIATIAVMEN